MRRATAQRAGSAARETRPSRHPGHSVGKVRIGSKFPGAPGRLRYRGSGQTADPQSTTGRTLNGKTGAVEIRGTSRSACEVRSYVRTQMPAAIAAMPRTSGINGGRQTASPTCGTPAQSIRKLSDAFHTAMGDPAYARLPGSIHVEVSYRDSDALATCLRQTLSEFGAEVRQIGLPSEVTGN